MRPGEGLRELPAEGRPGDPPPDASHRPGCLGSIREPRPRPTRDQHDPHALDRRDPEGQLRPPRHADGARPGRLHALAALPALRPGRPDLAGPGPLRALRRARLDVALLAALSGRRQSGRPRLRGRRRPRRLAQRHRELPPARLAGARAPRVPLDLRGRDDHRPARPGHRHLDRHGDRRQVAGRPLQPAGLRALRLRRLRDRRRRLLHGGGLQSRPPRSPVTSSSTTSAGSTTTTTSRSTAKPTSPTTTTSPPASWATAGTSPGSATPTTPS